MAAKDSQAILEATTNYFREAESAKQPRMEQNRANFDTYHMRGNFSHKLKGQSKEFLPRQTQAVEQIAQFLVQGLMDFGDFFSADLQPGVKDALFEPHEVEKLLLNQLKKADFYNYVLDSLKSGLLGALIVTKVHGQLVPRRRFVTEGASERAVRLLREKDFSWQLKIDLVRQKNYYPDPTGKGLYRIEEIELDSWELEKLAKANPEAFDQREVATLLNSTQSSGEELKGEKHRETNQAPSIAGYRRTVRLRECWGNILDPATGKLLYERKVWTVANEKHLIMPPRAYSTWNNEDPYVERPLIRVPHSVWHKALMDAATSLNLTVNEIFNLLVDSGIQSVFGLKQVRENWLEDASEIDGGIYPGQTLGVNAACPPGAKVVERIDTNSAGAGEASQAFTIGSGELNQAMMQNDLRVGTLPPRAVKATEVVASEQSITSVFTGVAKSYEGNIENVEEKAWNLILQNFKRLDADETKALLGAERYEELSKLSEKTIFAKTFGGFSFSVFGITQTVNKIKDFRKLTAMLQTVSGNPQLMEAFVRRYSFTKLLGELMKALDINVERIELDNADQQMNSMLPEGSAGGPNGGPAPMGPDEQSQLAQAGSFDQFEVEPSQMEGMAFE